jgi:hypothetical protein
MPGFAPYSGAHEFTPYALRDYTTHIQKLVVALPIKKLSTIYGTSIVYDLFVRS